MARLSVKYDDELKEQVFVLRGDEDYSRTTKTILTISNPVLHINNFDLPITVDVLRDKGEASIFIYDNDVVIDSIIDWSSQNNTRSIVLTGLNYDIPHNLSAKYNGNNRCSPSKSEEVSLTVEDTNRFTSSLKLTSNNKNYGRNGTYTNTVQIVSDSSQYITEQPINIYYDQELILSGLTDTNGNYTFSIPDVGDDGLHNIVVEFEGNRNLITSKLDYNISVGYKVEIIDYPEVLVEPAYAYSDELNVTVKVTDYLNNPVNGYVRIDSPYRNVPNPMSNEIYLRNGTGTVHVHYYYAFHDILDEFNRTSIIQAKYSTSSLSVARQDGDDLTVYESEEVTINCVRGISVQLSGKEILTAGNTENIQIYTNSLFNNTPVTLNGILNETVLVPYDEDMGRSVLTKTINGTGIGGKDSRNITATFGNSSATKTYSDYVQYWTPNNIINRSYTLLNANLLDLTNYFKIASSYNKDNGGGVFFAPTDASATFEFVNLTAPANTKVYFSSNNGYTRYADSDTHASISGTHNLRITVTPVNDDPYVLYRWQMQMGDYTSRLMDYGLYAGIRGLLFSNDVTFTEFRQWR